MGLLDFHNTYRILFAAYLKHSSFWPSADVEPMSNDQLPIMPWQCAYDLSMCILPP
jgi:hypothetical protein